MEEAIRKYKYIWNIFLQSLDAVPFNTKSKKKYALPHRTLLKYNINGADKCSSKNEAKLC